MIRDKKQYLCNNRKEKYLSNDRKGTKSQGIRLTNRTVRKQSLVPLQAWLKEKKENGTSAN